MARSDGVSRHLQAIIVFGITVFCIKYLSFSETALVKLPPGIDTGIIVGGLASIVAYSTIGAVISAQRDSWQEVIKNHDPADTSHKGVQFSAKTDDSRTYFAKAHKKYDIYSNISIWFDLAFPVIFGITVVLLAVKDILMFWAIMPSLILKGWGVQ